MLERLFFKNILNDTFDKKIDIGHELCLRRKSERYKCEKCFSSCPEGAIELTRGSIKIDPILCSGCNFCISSCYSRALSSEKRPYLRACNKFLDSPTSKWGCFKTKENADVNFGCLGTIDNSFLLALFYADLDLEVFLNFSKCQGCEYESYVNEKKEILDYISNNKKCQHLKVTQVFEDFKAEDVNLSRRDFFKSIFDSGKSYSKETIRETYKSLGIDFENKEDLDNLIKILLKKGDSISQYRSFMKDYIFSVLSNEKCTLCNECVVYCPKGALKIENSVDSKDLTFDIKKCNFCGRCLEKCRFDALYKGIYENKEKVSIFKKIKERCKSCRVLSVDLNEDKLCPTCQKRRNNRLNK